MCFYHLLEFGGRTPLPYFRFMSPPFAFDLKSSQIHEHAHLTITQLVSNVLIFNRELSSGCRDCAVNSKVPGPEVQSYVYPVNPCGNSSTGSGRSP